MSVRTCRPIGWVIALVTPTLLTAQGGSGVTGVVFDSLRTMRPVGGAEVVLLGSGTKVRTDEQGRFHFASIPPTATAIAHWAPWLDSLALPPLRVDLASLVRGGSEVVLATPSTATYQRAVCGAELGSLDGVLMGEARDALGAPVADAIVVARWTETSIGAGALSERLVATVDTTTASGHFALCGVPLVTVVSLRTIEGSRGSGEQSVAMSSPVQRHDVIVGSALVRARVRGRVVAASDVPVVGAAVRLRGDSSRTARTDSAGAFEIAVPLRSGELHVRAVGYEPAHARLMLRGETFDEVRLALSTIPPELPTVNVTADMFAHERRGFEERRRGATGHFITDSQLVRLPVIGANSIADLVPRVRAALTRGKPLLMMSRGAGLCHPRFYEDGIDLGELASTIDRQLQQHDLLARAKRIEVYTANHTPPKFNDFDGCGAVVVWTR